MVLVRNGKKFIDRDHQPQVSHCSGSDESGKKDDKKPVETSGDNGKMETEGAVAERGNEDDQFWPWFMPPRRWMGPSLGSGDELEKTIGRANQLMRVKEDDTKFEVSLVTHEFRPDELKVNVNNNVLTVEGKHEEKSEDGANFTARQFFRRYTLPRGCEAATINSNLSSDGVLMITPPKNPALAHNERVVPIQMQEKK